MTDEPIKQNAPSPRLEDIPDFAWEALQGHGIERGSVLFAARADRFADGGYGEVVLFQTGQALHVLKGVNTARKVLVFGSSAVRMTRKAKQALRRRLRMEKRLKAQGKPVPEPERPEQEPMAFEEKNFESYPLESFEKMEMIDAVSGGMIALQQSRGEGKVVCMFTNHRRGVLHRYVQLVGKLKDGKTLTDEDFARHDRKRCCPKCGLPYPQEGRQICPRCVDNRNVFMRLLSQLPRYKWRVGLVVLCMVATACLGLLSPILSGRILFDEVLTQGGKYYGMVWQLILVMFLARALSVALNIAYGRLNAGLVSDIAYDLRVQIFGAMQRLSLAFFSRQQTGRLMTRVNDDPVEIEYFFHEGVPLVLVNGVTFIGVVIIAFLNNWQLALCAIVPVPIAYFFLRKLYPVLDRLYYKRYRRNSSLNNLINDTLRGTRVVKAFGREEREVKRFTGRNRALLNMDIQLGNTLRTAYPFFNLLIQFSSVVIWFVGGAMIIKPGSSFTYGQLVTFASLFGMMIAPLESLCDIPAWWSYCMNAAQRMYEVIDADSEVPYPANPKPLEDMKGEVTFKDVTFSYEQGKPILKDISLHVEAGHMLGIVGRSGAGKTTLINVLQRLYDVDSGSVSIDGIDVRDIKPEHLRGQIGVVSQETFIFRGTIAENIAYAHPDCTREDIVRAARTAGAHDFIMRLPEGYDTMVGHGGRDLSGGERQRVSIARAILHNPRILILDEATSAVDTATEKAIQEAIEALSVGRTVISIAHRLSTLRNADSLVVVEDGKIVESGTHVELIRKKGTYFKLVQQQSVALRLKGVENLG
nr:ABC transporter ATP-binding protein [bacterium]